jgi:hypothetical protein
VPMPRVGSHRVSGAYLTPLTSGFLPVRQNCRRSIAESDSSETTAARRRRAADSERRGVRNYQGTGPKEDR